MNDIEVCPQCYYVSEATSVFMCPYCRWIASTSGELGYKRRFLHERMLGVGLNFYQAIAYTLPRFTFRDHLRDCFGWMTYDRHARYDEFVEAFCEKLEEALPWLKSLRWRS